jgi:hypothetical protein
MPIMVLEKAVNVDARMGEAGTETRMATATLSATRARAVGAETVGDEVGLTGEVGEEGSVGLTMGCLVGDKVGPLVGRLAVGPLVVGALVRPLGLMVGADVGASVSSAVLEDVGGWAVGELSS